MGWLHAAWQRFRARSAYFQLRIVVVVAYASVVVATLILVFAPLRAGRNDLGARITVLPGDPIMGRYFVVQNESRRDWLGVRFEIDGGYQMRRDAVLAGEKITLYVHDFTRQERVNVKQRSRAQPVAAPPTLPVGQLRIESGGLVTIHRLASSL